MYKHLSQVPETLFHLFHPVFLHISTVYPHQMAPASFLLTKTTPCGSIGYLLITQLSLLHSFPNSPIEVVTLLYCLSITLGSHWLFLSLTRDPTFNLQPTVMTKYLPLILPPGNFLNQFISLHPLIYSSLHPGLYNIFLEVCLPASFLLCSSS